MTCIIGCDHAGLDLANEILEHLNDCASKIIHIFPQSGQKVDYPDYAHLVCREVLSEKAQNNNVLGILVCGSGIGMSIAANKIKGIRAALCTDEYMAHYARAHNNANVLCLGARVVGSGVAKNIVGAFLNTAFEGGRHKIRVDKINLLQE